MKRLLWNLLWLTIFTLSFCYAIHTLKDANRECLDGVSRIENRLNEWELLN